MIHCGQNDPFIALYIL